MSDSDTKGRFHLNPKCRADWDALMEKVQTEMDEDNGLRSLERISHNLAINGSTINGLNRQVGEILKDKDFDVRKFLIKQKLKRKQSKKKSLVPFVVNENTSERMKDWLKKHVSTGYYDHLYVLSYTNETLHSEIKSFELHVKSLARNWVVEKQAEGLFNKANPDRPREWEKNEAIKHSAFLLEDHQNSFKCKSCVQRFYEGEPLFKGAILWSSTSDRAVAYLGLYKWNPKREDGGSPYQGMRWVSMDLSSHDPIQKEFIVSVKSRFDLLWENSKTYDEVKEQEEQVIHSSSVYKIWCTASNLPYKILIPGHLKFVVTPKTLNDFLT